jgi:hypothetical protein
LTRTLIAAALLCFATAALAQQGAATGPPLNIRTQTLPNARVRQSYQFELQAEGGILPLKWTLVSGDLPPGLKLGSDGILRGAPTNAGDFSFVVQVEDGGKPQSQRSQPLSLRVVTPLLVEWLRAPRVNGQRVDGAIKVTNSTEQDFDLTAVIVAVNDYGRATALGYQHLKLTHGTSEFEIPFGENLPFGAYDINVDVIGEVAADNTIYKVHLAPKEKIQVRQGP